MITLAVTFDRYSPRVDGSYGLSFSSALELNREQAGDLHDHKGTIGWLVYSENEVQESDLPKDEAEGKKTHAERQRNILYRIWEQEGKNGEFRDFYSLWEEKINTWLKSKLEPI